MEWQLFRRAIPVNRRISLQIIEDGAELAASKTKRHASGNAVTADVEAEGVRQKAQSCVSRRVEASPKKLPACRRQVYKLTPIQCEEVARDRSAIGECTACSFCDGPEPARPQIWPSLALRPMCDPHNVQTVLPIIDEGLGDEGNTIPG
jgi:hypothetical protein